MSTVNIIGSGIMGMLSAHELLKKGFKVSLFDRGLAGQESTWAGGGIISPLFPWRYDNAVTQLSLQSQSIYQTLLDELHEFSDIDPEYNHSGMLLLDCDDINKAQAWSQQFKVSLEQIDSHALHDRFKRLNNSFSQALWMPQVHQIRNPRFAHLAQQSLINRGVTFHENMAIDKLEINNNAVQAIRCGNTTFAADLTLVCTGAWTGDFLNLAQSDVDENISIHPVHGQMLLLKTAKPLLTEIVLHKGRYIIPRNDGHVLIGSTTEMIGFKKQTTESVKESLIAYAQQTIPELKQATVAKHWSGLRPGSINGIPTISAHSKIKNLYINAGHYRNGLVTAPASACHIQQVMSNEPTDIDADLYRMS